MIHCALREMVIAERGTLAWEMIVLEAAVEPVHMVSAIVHEDAVTMRIMDAAARSLDLDMAECLEAFGESWISFAARGSYGSFLDFLGSDLSGFIANLDRMHVSIRHAMPAASMPSFATIEEKPGFVSLVYRSEREGLEPFVSGLLKGLLARFGLTGKVICVGKRDSGIQFDLSFVAGPSAAAVEG
jgi:Haem-NO-binding